MQDLISPYVPFRHDCHVSIRCIATGAGHLRGAVEHRLHRREAGASYAEPLTFLALRFVCVASLLGLLALVLRRPWPADWRTCAHLAVAGIILHAGYLSGVFSAIHSGLSAGQVALIVGLQPLLTALLSSLFLGERVGRIQWLGLVLGFVGVVLVVGTRLGAGGSHAALALALMALASITLGTLYQKRFVPSFDLWTGSVLQFAAALLVVGPLAIDRDRAHRVDTEFPLCPGVADPGPVDRRDLAAAPADSPRRGDSDLGAVLPDAADHRFHCLAGFR